MKYSQILAFITESNNIWYHGTNNKFPQFIHTKDIGFHFGNKTQAKKRGKYLIKVKLDYNNPLYLTDVFEPYLAGAYRLSAELLNRNIISKHEYELILDEVVDIYKTIKNLLINKGYDSIIYTNKFEGSGESIVVFDSSQISIVS